MPKNENESEAEWLRRENVELRELLGEARLNVCGALDELRRAYSRLCERLDAMN